MKDKVVQSLKDASETLDGEIKSAHNRMMNLEESRFSKARMLVQEAINEILKTG